MIAETGIVDEMKLSILTSLETVTFQCGHIFVTPVPSEAISRHYCPKCNKRSDHFHFQSPYTSYWAYDLSGKSGMWLEK